MANSSKKNGSKFCTGCNKNKPATEFYNRHSKCKKCCYERDRERLSNRGGGDDFYKMFIG